MKIIGVPTSDMLLRGASVRLRFLTFLKHCGYPWEQYCGNLDGDVFYVEKKSSPEVIEVAKKARAKGMKVIFDLNDGMGYRDKDPKKRDDKAMCLVAHVITCNSEERAVILRKLTGKPVYVIPDGIDYGIKPCHRVELREEVRRICTFGHYKQVLASVKVLKRISVDGKKFYITDRPVPGLEKWRGRQWRYKKFIKQLKTADLCYLFHVDNEVSKLKSNNRLVVCMALGLPAVVSDTYVYAKTAKDAGVPEITNAVVMQDFGVRQRVSQKGFDYAWENYRPEKMGEMFRDMLMEVM